MAHQFSALLLAIHGKYMPNWESLDQRPLPQWYDDAKVGIFLHWGVFSVPAYKGAWFWDEWKNAYNGELVAFMRENYPPNFTYQDFAPLFTAEFYEPEKWAEVFNASGARYVVLTSKHHEGFTLWPSKFSWNWNTKNVGPNRDLVGELANAIRAKTPHIRFGLYHSLFEWFNPLYLRDKKNGFQTNEFVLQKTLPELYELVNNYSPEIVWSDGDWEAQDWYWNSTQFLAWLFNESPVKETVVVNDRWGSAIPCKHGSFYTCHDRYNPGVLQYHKWENCMTLDKNYWAHNRMAGSREYMTIHELLTVLAETISCGGNLLINTGPTSDGRILPIMEERYRELGSWLEVNGEAIYSSRPWSIQKDSNTTEVWYTSKEKIVYAIVLKWPKKSLLFLKSVVASTSTRIILLGYKTKRFLKIKQTSAGLIVAFPDMSETASLWAWVLKMTNVRPSKIFLTGH